MGMILPARRVVASSGVLLLAAILATACSDEPIVAPETVPADAFAPASIEPEEPQEAQAAAERFLITPSAFDFGQVLVGETSAPQVVVVSNLGPGPVTPEVTGGAAGEFGGNTDCQGVELQEGESCQIMYRFTPTEAGPVSGSTSGSISGQTFAFTFRGEGLGAPRFAISPTSFDFGQVQVGTTSAAQVVTVRNLGPGPATPQITGGAAGEFGGSTDCQGVELQEGESCQFTYRFTPTEAGAVTRSTSGSISGQAFAFTFRGEGLGPGAEATERFLITATGFDFGEVLVGQTSTPQIVTVTNLGPGPVTPQITGGAAGEFGGSTDCQGIELQEGESCRFAYQFTATEPGEVTRSTSGNISGQSFAFTFRGIAAMRDRFLITPVGFDFGHTQVGQTSDPQVVTVTNLGPGPVTPQITGGAAGEFGGNTNCQGIELQEGESCQFAYRFSPTEPGEVTRSTSGSISGQSFAFTFRGVGVGFVFGGFLPPINRPAPVRPGSMLPVKAQLLDGLGTPISDDIATGLAAACAVTVTFGGTPELVQCAGYHPDTQHFQVNLRIPRDLASGSYPIVLEVRVGGVLVTTGSVQIEVG
jgi:hypothetical protein